MSRKWVTKWHKNDTKLVSRNRNDHKNNKLRNNNNNNNNSIICKRDIVWKWCLLMIDIWYRCCWSTYDGLGRPPHFDGILDALLHAHCLAVVIVLTDFHSITRQKEKISIWIQSRLDTWSTSSWSWYYFVSEELLGDGWFVLHLYPSYRIFYLFIIIIYHYYYLLLLFIYY